MQQPLISIIIATFNAEKSIEQTILSVINQSYTLIEFIIIDGGSTDKTVDIIKKYDEKISYWVSEPDAGVYDAMNKGAKVSNGKWIYFLGAGDIMCNVLHKLVSNFTDTDIIYYGDVYKLDELKIYDGHFTPYKLAVKNICHQAIFYPASVFKKYNYDLKYRMLADHALNMRCSGDNNLGFKYLPVIVCLYEGDGLSALNLDYTFFNDKLSIIKSNFSMLVYYYASFRTMIAKILKKNQFNKGAR